MSAPRPMTARAEWLRDVARRAEVRMDRRWAPVYDGRWGAIDPTHARMLAGVLDRHPPGSRVLDAACGTGKYWPMLLARGMKVIGTDRSAGMLAQAHQKHPDVPTRKHALQDLSDVGVHDIVLCIDAMEGVPPEDWPTIFSAFARAIRRGGELYLTVELPEPGQLEASQGAARARGWPIVVGEDAHDDGYHYYPILDQVRAWLNESGFGFAEEAVGDGLSPPDRDEEDGQLMTRALRVAIGLDSFGDAVYPVGAAEPCAS